LLILSIGRLGSFFIIVGCAKDKVEAIINIGIKYFDI